jgi:glutamate racemase
MDVTLPSLHPRIAVFDSGVGGTGVLEAIRERAPWADLVYVADKAFGPYGERTLDEVRERTELLARYLVSAGAGLIVIACNSASAAALHHLRAAMPDTLFVGMEPAVKPAAEQTNSGVIGVMATGATFQGELFRDLVRNHSENVSIVEQACPGLAAAIESGADVGELLDRYLPPMVEAGADVVVLGCTHYPLIRGEIQARLPAGVVLIDPAPAVARRTVDVSHDHGIDLRGAGATWWWSTAGTVDPADPRPWEPIDIPATAVAAVRIADTTLTAIEGDITSMAVDAITNAANVELRHGGGVALAIARAGGPTIDEESAEWVATYGPLEPGIAALTSAGRMPSTYVIHVAGPVHRDGEDNEALLAAATLAALELATEIDARSIAVPAISAGIYGYPPDEATVVIAETVAEYLSDDDTTLRSVRLVGYDDAMARRFGRAIAALTLEG